MNEKLNNFEEDTNATSANQWDTLKEVPFAGNSPASNLDPFKSAHIENQNLSALNEPTLKNGYLEQRDLFITDEEQKSLETVAKKLQSGARLEAKDIISLADPNNTNSIIEQSEEFLNGLGLSEGQDFDVRMPSIYQKEDGTKQETPLQISFKNSDGTITRIDIDKGLTYDAESNRMVPTGNTEITSFIGDDSNVVSNSAPERNNINNPNTEFKRFNGNSESQ